jgi:hypothetical protein
MMFWKTYRRVICAWIASALLVPFALINFTPRIQGLSRDMIALAAWFLCLTLIRIVAGIAMKERERFITFYTVLLCSSVVWLPALVNVKIHLTEP